jgi:hypothetical protein
MTALEELQELIRGSRKGSRVDWHEIERALGFALPADYKRLVELYGSSAIDNFIWILEPASRNEHLDLLRQMTLQLQALRQLRDQGETIPYDIESTDGHLIPWAITDNGDVCYWLRTPSAPPEMWTVLVDEARGPFWEHFSGSASEFLAAVLSGRFQSNIFPDDFPSEAPTFRLSEG